MSLNELKLSPFLTAKLYEKSLVQNNQELMAVSNTTIAKDANVNKQFTHNNNIADAQLSINFLGNNANHIVIIISEPNHVFLDDEQLNFLINILSACKKSMQDVALINAHHTELVTPITIDNQFAPKQLIFLGIEPHLLQYPIQIPLYKIQQYNNQQYLSAASLQTLIADKEEKKNLWRVLKQLFEI